MLLRFGAKNYLCFKDWMEIDLTVNNTVPSDVSMNLSALTVMCFKGANGSGKSNALKAFSFITEFATNSMLTNPDSLIPLDTYFNNNEYAQFCIDFEVDKIYYCYELKVSKERVLEEHLIRKLSKPNSRKVEVFKRENNKITKNTLYVGHSDFIFRSNASFISTLKMYGLKEIDDIYNYLHQNIINVNTELDKSEIYKVTKEYYEEPKYLNFVKKVFQHLDTGIKEIKIQSSLDNYNNTIYYPVFIHEVKNDYGMSLVYKMESKGIIKLYCDLLSYIKTLLKGSVLILDNFDNNLHPDILPYLLELFIKQDNNTHNAQLIFTTHNNDIMDLLGRYRIYLFEKEEGESYCYRLDEIPLRNDRSIYVPYKRGQIGGVPRIGKKA